MSRIDCSICQFNYLKQTFITKRLNSFITKKEFNLPKYINKLNKLEVRSTFSTNNAEIAKIEKEIKKLKKIIEIEKTTYKWVWDSIDFENSQYDKLKLKDPCESCVGYYSPNSCIGCSCYECAQR